MDGSLRTPFIVKPYDLKAARKALRDKEAAKPQEWYPSIPDRIMEVMPERFGPLIKDALATAVAPLAENQSSVSSKVESLDSKFNTVESKLDQILAALSKPLSEPTVHDSSQQLREEDKEFMAKALKAETRVLHESLNEAKTQIIEQQGKQIAEAVKAAGKDLVEDVAKEIRDFGAKISTALSNIATAQSVAEVKSLQEELVSEAQSMGRRIDEQMKDDAVASTLSRLDTRTTNIKDILDKVHNITAIKYTPESMSTPPRHDTSSPHPLPNRPPLANSSTPNNLPKRPPRAKDSTPSYPSKQPSRADRSTIGYPQTQSSNLLTSTAGHGDGSQVPEYRPVNAITNSGKSTSTTSTPVAECRSRQALMSSKANSTSTERPHVSEPRKENSTMSSSRKSTLTTVGTKDGGGEKIAMLNGVSGAVRGSTPAKRKALHDERTTEDKSYLSSVAQSPAKRSKLGNRQEIEASDDDEPKGNVDSPGSISTGRKRAASLCCDECKGEVTTKPHVHCGGCDTFNLCLECAEEKLYCNDCTNEVHLWFKRKRSVDDGKMKTTAELSSLKSKNGPAVREFLGFRNPLLKSESNTPSGKSTPSGKGTPSGRGTPSGKGAPNDKKRQSWMGHKTLLSEQEIAALCAKSPYTIPGVRQITTSDILDWPKNVVSKLYNRDTNNPGHRRLNVQNNSEGRAICWMSQGYMSKDWAANHGVPDMPTSGPKSNKVVKMKQLWQPDDGYECPHCQVMRKDKKMREDKKENGTRICFIFTSETEVIIFPPKPKAATSNERKIVEELKMDEDDE